METDGMHLFDIHPMYDVTGEPSLLHNFLLPDENEVDVVYGPTNTTAVNESAPFIDRRDEYVAKIEVAIQAVIFFLALVGNGFVLLALRYHKRKTSRLHIFITHLCIADICVAFFNILPQMAWDITFRFQGNDLGCRVIKFLQVLVIYVSTYILVVTAIDRYRAICHPLSNYKWTNKKSHTMVAIAWVAAVLMSSPQLGIFSMQEVSPGSGVMDCWGSFHPAWTVQLYVTTFSSTVFFIPILILAVLYGRICYVVWCNVYSRSSPSPEHGSNVGHSTHQPFTYLQNGCVHYRFVGKGQSSSGGMCSNNRYDKGRRLSTTGISRAKMKTIKLTIVVIFAYIVCWAPFIITQMWWAFDETAPYNNSTFVICLLLVSLNSCCNPWIYMAFSDSLVQQAIPCCRRKKRKPKQPQQKYGEHMKYKFSPETEPKVRCDHANNYQNDQALPETFNNGTIHRKSILSTRTTSTKMTTLYRTDSKNAAQKNVIMKYSREHGIIAAANIANWPCAVVYTPKNACSSLNGAMKMDTKVCECKNCVKAMEDKSKRNRLSSWKERTEEKTSYKGTSSSSSKSKSSSKDKNSKTKKLIASSDNCHPFLSYNSYASEIPGNLEVEERYSSV